MKTSKHEFTDRIHQNKQGFEGKKLSGKEFLTFEEYQRVHIRLLSGIRAEVVQFSSIKMSIYAMYFLFVFKLSFEKRGREIFGNHYFPSGDQKFILDHQLAPVLKKLILDPGILQ